MIPFPTCSLLISTYNWPEALELVLESVKRQTKLPDEVIVADDGSGNATRELIDKMRESFPCPLIHVWHEDDGFRLSAIRNKAIAQASGEYILQIDGDCILHENFVVDHLDASEYGFFVSAGRVLLSEKFSKNLLSSKKIGSLKWYSAGISNRMNAIHCDCLRKYLECRIKMDKPQYVKGCNMAFWKKDLLAVNGFNEDISGWGREDSEIAVRLSKLGRRRKYLKFGAVQYHLFHKENDRSRDAANIELLNRVIAGTEFFTPNGIVKN